MAKAKVEISETQIVDINEFMNNYVGIIYEWNDKLTHDNMIDFLLTKNKRLKKVVFDDVSKEKLLTGEQIVVQDAVNKILIYENPRMELDALLEELHSISKKERKEIRKQILEEIQKDNSHSKKFVKANYKRKHH